MRYENLLILTKKVNTTEMSSERIARVLREFDSIVQPINKEVVEFTWIKDPPMDQAILNAISVIQGLLPQSYTIYYDNKEEQAVPFVHPFHLFEFMRDPTVDEASVAGNFIYRTLEAKYPIKITIPQLIGQTNEMASIIGVLQANQPTLETRVKPFCARKDILVSEGLTTTSPLSEQFESVISRLDRLTSEFEDLGYQAYCYNPSFLNLPIELFQAWLFQKIPSAFYFDDSGRIF